MMVLTMPSTRTPQRAASSHSAPLATRRAMPWGIMPNSRRRRANAPKRDMRRRCHVACGALHRRDIGDGRLHRAEEASEVFRRRNARLLRGGDGDEGADGAAAFENAARLAQLGLRRAGGDLAVDDVEIPEQPRLIAAVQLGGGQAAP